MVFYFRKDSPNYPAPNNNNVINTVNKNKIKQKRLTAPPCMHKNLASHLVFFKYNNNKYSVYLRLSRNSTINTYRHTKAHCRSICYHHSTISRAPSAACRQKHDGRYTCSELRLHCGTRGNRQMALAVSRNLYL